MSLINQMLRDLDERHASSLERSGLAAQVRALPREKRFPWASVLPIALGTAIGAAGIWLALDASTSPSPSASTTAAPPPAAVPPPAVALALPTLVVPMPTEPTETLETSQTVADAEAAKQGAVRVAESLQLDFNLSHASVPAEPASVSPSPAVSPIAPPAAPTPATATPTRAATTAPPVTSLPTQIDKRPRSQSVETADGAYRKALAAYRQGQASEAEAGFQAALRLDARHVSARQALLSLLLSQRRWPEAQTLAADGLALLSAQPGWAMILARLQVEQGQLAEAERTMAEHAAYGERSGDYLAFHGLLLERLRRPQEAREAFLKAREAGNLPPETAAAIEQRLR